MNTDQYCSVCFLISGLIKLSLSVSVITMCSSYYKSSAVAEMGDRGHNRRGAKEARAAVPFSRGAGTPSNTKSPGLRPTSIPSGILMHPAATIKMGQKLGGGGALPPFGERSWVRI